MVLLAYRYATNLLVIQASLGDLEMSNLELKAALEDLDQNWFVGIIDTEEWTQSIVQEKEKLFALEYSDGTYYANLLTLQEMSWQVKKPFNLTKGWKTLTRKYKRDLGIPQHRIIVHNK